MSAETIFYVAGIALAVFAVAVSFVGLRNERFPGSSGLFAGTVLIFVALVGGATAYGVINAREEQEHRDAELAEAEAGKEAEGGGAEVPGPTDEDQRGTAVPAPPGPAQKGDEGAGGGPKGPGGTLELAADETEVAYDQTEMQSAPGEITIEFANPSLVQHDVVIEQDGRELARSDLIAEGDTSVTATLAPGEYTFFCSVPGHREAGMEGTLSIG